MVPNLRFVKSRVLWPAHISIYFRMSNKCGKLCRLSAISVSGDAAMNPAAIGLEDGGESMWEDEAGEDADCDFADDDVDGGKDQGDPEVKELMSEILGKEEADEVLGQLTDPPETEKTRVHLPELASLSPPKNKMVDQHEGKKSKKRHSTRRIGSGRARNRAGKNAASATFNTSASNAVSGGGNKKKRYRRAMRVHLGCENSLHAAKRRDSRNLGPTL